MILEYCFYLFFFWPFFIFILSIDFRMIKIEILNVIRRMYILINEYYSSSIYFYTWKIIQALELIHFILMTYPLLYVLDRYTLALIHTKEWKGRSASILRCFNKIYASIFYPHERFFICDYKETHRRDICAVSR